MSFASSGIEISKYLATDKSFPRTRRKSSFIFLKVRDQSHSRVYDYPCFQSFGHFFEGPDVAKTGHAPMPAPTEKPVGGHAVMAVGYDDSNQWFIVRNSWGETWGMEGYFTLPYTYLVNQSIASDFWTIRIVS